MLRLFFVMCKDVCIMSWPNAPLVLCSCFVLSCAGLNVCACVCVCRWALMAAARAPSWSTALSALQGALWPQCTAAHRQTLRTWCRSWCRYELWRCCCCKSEVWRVDGNRFERKRMGRRELGAQRGATVRVSAFISVVDKYACSSSG
jgi:hypothetical protein